MISKIDSQYDVIIGIDPDREKSGVAFLRKKDGMIEALNLSIGDILDACLAIKNDLPEFKIKIIIEASWKIEKSNFHASKGARSRTALGETIAKRVGQNQGAGISISKLLQHYKFEVQEVLPQRKHGMKTEKGWNPEGRKLFYKMTEGKLTKKEISDDCKDAVLLVLGR